MTLRVDSPTTPNNDGPLVKSIVATPAFFVADVRGVSAADAGSSGASETDLKTLTIAAKAFASMQGVQFVMTGICANNAAAKTIRAYFGTDKCLDVALPTSKPVIFTLTMTVYRLTAATQRVFCDLRVLDTTTPTAPVASAYQTHTDTTQDETAAIIAKATGQATTTNDMVAKTTLLQSF